MNHESKLLEGFAAALKRLGYNTYRIAELHDGKIYSMDLLPASACLNSYSVAKAFTVTAAGLLFDKGCLAVDEKIIDIFRDEFPPKYDHRWDRMTIDHVMRHKGGFSGGFLDIDAQAIETYGTDDFLQYMFHTELENEPGTVWNYSDGAFYLMSRVISKKTGRLMDELMWCEIFYPMEFQEVAWSKCPMGYPMGATGLYIRTQDMVKLGALYMNGGIYEGKRLLSEAWVRKVLERGYEMCSAGVADAYGKGGMCGQMLLVFPSAKRVVAWHSFDSHDMGPLFQWLYDHIDL